MKLYRIDEEAPDGGYASHFTIRAAIEWELLVEVEKCVHGKYDTHEYTNNDINCKHPWWVCDDLGCDEIKQCLGAGLEDTK